MKDTPRTERYVLNALPEVVPAEFARELEREINQLKAEIQKTKISENKQTSQMWEDVADCNGDDYRHSF